MHIMYDVVNICKSVRTDAGGPGVFAYPTVYAHRCSCGLEGSYQHSQVSCQPVSAGLLPHRTGLLTFMQEVQEPPGSSWRGNWRRTCDLREVVLLPTERLGLPQQTRADSVSSLWATRCSGCSGYLRRVSTMMSASDECMVAAEASSVPQWVEWASQRVEELRLRIRLPFEEEAALP